MKRHLSSRPVKRGKVLVNTHYFSKTHLSLFIHMVEEEIFLVFHCDPAPCIVFCLKTGYLDQLWPKARYYKWSTSRQAPTTDQEQSYGSDGGWGIWEEGGRGMLGRQSLRRPLHLPANAGSKGKENGLMRKSQQKL